MNKVYNTQNDIASEMKEFVIYFLKCPIFLSAFLS